jgi:hypothetical protein
MRMSSASDYVSFLAVSFSAVSLLLSYRYYTGNTRLSTFAEVFVNLYSDETRRNRYTVRSQKNEFSRLKQDPKHDLSPEVEDAGRYVASAYDRVGFFVSHNNKLTDEYLRWQGDVILEMWDILGPWVEGPWRDEYLDSVRVRRPNATPIDVSRAYSNYFQWLKERAKEREDKLLKQ